ncbi:uncharacterized protein LOC133833001 [Humulus lupulus]|uniref:uncharacterized protein LOC133833001 n=1 Tax=Humulus lupulus TaxID=3486 RepID=UPI002B4053A7|nr:uncharacterized protein LOC133833001 [Humulus lupulus]
MDPMGGEDLQDDLNRSRGNRDSNNISPPKPVRGSRMDEVRNATHPQAVADPNIQAQLDLLTRLVRYLTAPKLTNIEIERQRGSPFPDHINQLPIPVKFKMPTWKMYIGLEDPVSHVHNFELQTDLQRVRNDARCRIFPTTLSEITQQWFFKLHPGSITSWDRFVCTFYSQFSSAMPLPIEPNDLVDIKHKDNEPLKDYIQRIMREATRVKSLSGDGKLIAINSRVKVKSLFWINLKRKSARTTKEFFDRAEEFIKLEEAKRKVDNPTQVATKQGKTGLGNTTNPVEGGKNGAKNGKRSNGAGSSGNQNDNKKPKTPEQPKPREYIPKFTTYSILLKTRAYVFNATQVVVPYRRPPPMRKNANRWDVTKFCQFHNDYDHETNECNHL